LIERRCIRHGRLGHALALGAEDLWISHSSLLRTGTSGLASGCTGIHASSPLRECGPPDASLTAPTTLRLRSAFPLVGRAFSFAQSSQAQANGVEALGSEGRQAGLD
jgi:hypothetical protein